MSAGSNPQRYKVTVEAIVTTTKTVGHEWATIAHEPIPGTDGKTKPILGYTPQVEKSTTEVCKVYEQSVDSLDLAALVSVVNGIGAK